MSRGTFDELFARCWIGAPAAASTDLVRFAWSTFLDGRVLFSVLQRGTFGP
jgi:hypothetical protein